MANDRNPGIRPELSSHRTRHSVECHVSISSRLKLMHQSLIFIFRFQFRKLRIINWIPMSNEDDQTDIWSVFIAPKVFFIATLLFSLVMICKPRWDCSRSEHSFSTHSLPTPSRRNSFTYLGSRFVSKVELTHAVLVYRPEGGRSMQNESLLVQKLRALLGNNLEVCRKVSNSLATHSRHRISVRYLPVVRCCVKG